MYLPLALVRSSLVRFRLASQVTLSEAKIVVDQKTKECNELITNINKSTVVVKAKSETASQKESDLSEQVRATTNRVKGKSLYLEGGPID